MLSSNDQRRSCHEMPAYVSPLHTWQLWAELVPDSAPGLSLPVIAVMCSMSVWTALALAVYNKNQDCTGITEEQHEPWSVSHGSNPNADDLSVQSHFIYSKVGQGLSGMGKICLGCRSVKRKDVNVVVGYIWFCFFFFLVLFMSGPRRPQKLTHQIFLAGSYWWAFSLQQIMNFWTIA